PAPEDSMARSPNIKAEAKQLVEQLPEQASWDDVMYEVYVRQAIAQGRAAVREGRVVPHDQVLAKVLGSRK
ncbi:MAG: hypothetical protein ACHQXA_05385, partial [Gemmatimonadales bacterium]